jgi:hypothetical protein
MITVYRADADLNARKPRACVANFLRSFWRHTQPDSNRIRWIKSITGIDILNIIITVKLSLSTTPQNCILCLIKHHAMKTYWGSGGIASPIPNLGTKWRWVVSLTPRPLYPGEIAPITNWIGSWMDLRAGLETAVVKRNKYLSPTGNPNPVALRHVTTLTELSWLCKYDNASWINFNYEKEVILVTSIRNMKARFENLKVFRPQNTNISTR